MFVQPNNNYVNALKEYFGGPFKASRDKFATFSHNPNEEDPGDPYNAFFEDYKILTNPIFNAPGPSSQGTDIASQQTSVGHYKFYVGSGNAWQVTGIGVGNVGDGIYIIPSGAEVTVTQNGDPTVPDETNFFDLSTVVAGLSDFFAYVFLDGNDIDWILPYRGKAFYGNLVQSGNQEILDSLTLLVFTKDGKPSTMYLPSLGSGPTSNPVFFTHILGAQTDNPVIQFSGKEFDYEADDLPTGAYVEPTITFVPD